MIFVFGHYASAVREARWHSWGQEGVDWRWVRDQRDVIGYEPPYTIKVVYGSLTNDQLAAMRRLDCYSQIQTP